MAIYYFDIDDNGSVFPDEVGTECTGLDVKREAISALVGMIGESLPDGDHHRLEIKVRNDSGNVVLRLALNFDVESDDLSDMHRTQRYS